MKQAHTIGTLKLRLERRDGCLRVLLHAIESQGYRIDRFFLRGRRVREARGNNLNIEMVIRADEANASFGSLVARLSQLRGVNACLAITASPQVPAKTGTTPTGGDDARYYYETMRVAETIVG